MRGTRAKGTNPRALGTNPRALRRVKKALDRLHWNPPQETPEGQLPRWLRFEILKRDGFQCSYCGARPRDGARLQVDHIHPKAAGGTDDPSNLTSACEDCNMGKAARMLTEAVI